MTEVFHDIQELQASLRGDERFGEPDSENPFGSFDRLPILGPSPEQDYTRGVYFVGSGLVRVTLDGSEGTDLFDLASEFIEEEFFPSLDSNTRASRGIKGKVSELINVDTNPAQQNVFTGEVRDIGEVIESGVGGTNHEQAVLSAYIARMVYDRRPKLKGVPILDWVGLEDGTRHSFVRVVGADEAVPEHLTLITSGGPDADTILKASSAYSAVQLAA